MRAALENALRREKGFSLVFKRQPIISIEKYQVDEPIRFYELLTAIQLPEGLILDATYFISLVQESDDYAIAFDEQVVSNAAQLIATDNCCYTVNLTGATLRRAYLQQILAKVLLKYGAQQHKMMFELPENHPLGKTEAGYLAVLGTSYGLLLDDVGSPYSRQCAIAHIATLPLAGLKIDLSLVQKIDQNKVQDIIGPLLRIAQNRGIMAIAEGIEQEQTVDILRQLKEDYAPDVQLYLQGFLIGRPELT